MNFVDEIDLEVISGDGGGGVVRWNQTRRNQKGGPNGGDGGRGGDVLIKGVRDSSLLGKYRGNTLFSAGHGGNGGQNSLHGEDGEDKIILLPIGSIVHLKEKGTTFELMNEEEIVVLKGGRGGLGNEHFKSSRNVTPTESTEGKSGESDVLEIELKLIADLGLVGFPNAGKSSLLNSLTNSRAKVGNYAFTTLDPNLGDLFGYIIADIPGIIEGASEGRGLGHKFLRHINRTKALVYCISAERDDQIAAFRALLGELVKYDPLMEKLPFVILLTKTDLVSGEERNDMMKELKTLSDNVYSMSIHDEASVKTFSDNIVSFIQTLE